MATVADDFNTAVTDLQAAQTAANNAVTAADCGRCSTGGGAHCRSGGSGASHSASNTNTRGLTWLYRARQAKTQSRREHRPL